MNPKAATSPLLAHPPRFPRGDTARDEDGIDLPRNSAKLFRSHSIAFPDPVGNSLFNEIVRGVQSAPVGKIRTERTF